MQNLNHVIQSPTREALPLPVTALVLCGGKSRRMGRPKAFLPFEGTTMVNHVLNQVRDLFAEVFIVANEPDNYEDLGVDVVKDILPYRGPLGGILSGLLVAKHEYTFVIACDMPFVDKRLIREMTAARHGNDVVVLTHDMGVEPLLGLYSKNCIKPLEESLFAGNLSLQEFLSGLKAQPFEYDAGSSNGEELPAFFNVNTPQDYSRAIMGGASAAAVHPFPAKRAI
ncbi:MAG: molybdenum cofactor guanylyltransferase [Cyanobacteria bacterium SZAS-4]|nr:molybdenum cofactor guanylyltransferase [Cyanobacteria bacterium SZAS-4]